MRADRLTRSSFANPSSNRCYKSGMEQLAIKLLGFAAAACTTLAYAPQFVKVWKTRSTEDISLGMFLVMVLGILLWLLYGLLSGDAPLIVANAITIVLAGGILCDEAEVRLKRAAGRRKQTRRLVWHREQASASSSISPPGTWRTRRRRRVGAGLRLSGHPGRLDTERANDLSWKSQPARQAKFEPQFKLNCVCSSG